ncbi:biotin/lipoyl-containing protein [Clostridium sp. DL1XJH146]
MKKYRIKLNNKEYEVEVEELDVSTPLKSTPAKEVGAPTSAGAEEIVAPLPGNVFTINTTEGSSVKKGDTLLVLEAMKLENEIVCPRDGVVESIRVTKGQAVETGDCLVVLK